MKTLTTTGKHKGLFHYTTRFAIAGTLLFAGAVSAEEVIIDDYAAEIRAQGASALTSIAAEMKQESQKRMGREMLANIYRVEQQLQVAEKKLPQLQGPKITQCEPSPHLIDCTYNCYHNFSIGGLSWVSLAD